MSRPKASSFWSPGEPRRPRRRSATPAARGSATLRNHEDLPRTPGCPDPTGRLRPLRRRRHHARSPARWLPADTHRGRAVLRDPARRDRAVCRCRQANVAFFEAFGSAASRRWSGCAAACHRTCRSSPTSSAATSVPRPPARPWPCTTAWAWTRSRPTVRGFRGARAAAVTRRSLRLPVVPHLEPRRGRAAEPRSRGDAASGAPSEPLYARVARRAQAWGPAARWPGRRRHRSRRVGAYPCIAPGLALLVPGVGAQGGEVEPVLRFGPAVAARRRTPGGGLLVNVSRGISGAAGKAGGAPDRARRLPRCRGTHGVGGARMVARLRVAG